uniref:Uncharacterized protein n=1 Tax=Prymnesium polylepis TaxID=72548 RepID=A0A7S4HPF4_9EUKA|mmetsp:Transcript_59539/g.163344  ORF Transcript_59539/g.163344 Transcript_59539/m.163344 type:complete len:163 (-) Transcript_59539:224-712(-)
MARVEALGVGAALDIRTCTSNELASAAGRLLSESAVRDCLDALCVAMREADGGADSAARYIEGVASRDFSFLLEDGGADDAHPECGGAIGAAREAVPLRVAATAASTRAGLPGPAEDAHSSGIAAVVPDAQGRHGVESAVRSRTVGGHISQAETLGWGDGLD